MPDIALIPIIASFFGVSTNEFFDYNRLKTEKKVEDICTEAYKYRVCDPVKPEEILREGLKQFPATTSSSIISSTSSTPLSALNIYKATEQNFAARRFRSLHTAFSDEAVEIERNFSLSDKLQTPSHTIQTIQKFKFYQLLLTKIPANPLCLLHKSLILYLSSGKEPNWRMNKITLPDTTNAGKL